MKSILILITLFTAISLAQVIQGECSYYNDKYHGNPTASGEPYDKTKFTAASSRGHAFGTMLKVTNLKNGLSVNVKVNDKMGNKKRVLDLSRAAAEKVDMVRDGIAQLKIEPVGAINAQKVVNTPVQAPPTLKQPTAVQSAPSATGKYRLQYGAFKEGKKAASFSKTLHSKGIMNDIIPSSGTHKVVGVRTFSSKALAKTQVDLDVKSTGVKPFVVTY